MNLRKSAVFCENLRFGRSLSPYSSVTLSLPEPKYHTKGVRAIDARNSQLENRSNAAKSSVRAPGLSTDEREHSFFCVMLWGWLILAKGVLQESSVTPNPDNPYPVYA